MVIKNLSVIIPAYNEALVIEDSLNKIISFLQQQKAEWEIIVVDDGSTDATAGRVKEYLKEWPQVHLCRHAVNQGKGAALKTGVMSATKEWVLLTDADLSAPIEELEKFQPASEKEILIASRALPDSLIVSHQPWWREWGGKFLNKLIRLILKVPWRDTQCGFKLLPRQVAQEIFSQLFCLNFSFDVELLYRAYRQGYLVREVAVKWAHHPSSAVRPWRDGWRLVYDIWRIKFQKEK